MSSRKILAVAICVGLALLGRTALNHTRLSAASIPGPYHVESTPDFEKWVLDPEIAPEPDAIRLDRYGNEIETAVGEYRVDPVGEMYERHSPDTALPRLLPPEV